MGVTLNPNLYPVLSGSPTVSSLGNLGELLSFGDPLYFFVEWRFLSG